MADQFYAYDLINGTTQFADKYTENEKSLFERRLEIKIDEANPVAMKGFLSMYSNPVVNKMKYENAI